MEGDAPATKFRLSATSLFLTYPQCAVSKEDALRQLKEIVPVEKALVAEEAHEDGTPHVHAYLKLSKRINIKN